MKINSNSSNEETQAVDLSEVLRNLQKEYSNVFIQQYEDQIFMYRPLGRNEFKRLIEDERFNDYEKEEIVCQACVLWPENYDFENCEAGIPSMLFKEVLKNSFLDSIDSRKAILSYYRQEMFDLDNQITCIINEAFPQFDIEEIDQWDVAKTAKYLSRAEWKLQNFRGAQFNYDPFEGQQPQQPEQPAPQKRPVQTQEVEESPIKQGKIETLEERQQRLNMQGGAKEKLTPEKLAELKAKFPDINWEADTVMQEGIKGMNDSVDVTSPALRPGWGR